VDKIPNLTLPDGTTKPITEVEIDADLAEHLKPWRRPGADPSDYFNYGFDEFTWSLYCQKQKTMAAALKEQKDENAKINEMLMSQGMPAFPGLPPMPGMPSMGGTGGGNGPAGQQGAPGGGAAPPQGMPSMEEMMAVMAQQGITDPTQLGWDTFLQGMQAMQGGGGAGGVAPSGPSGGGQQQGYGQQGWQQGGGGGYSGGGGRRGRGGRGW